MLTDACTKLDRLECENILADVNPALEGSAYDPARVTILAQALSFYPGYQLLDIADFEQTPANRRFVIYKPGDVTVLNWTNEAIYRLNEKAPIVLNDETVADYVRFFFSYVRGRHGRFVICEGVDDVQWREDPPPAARRAVGTLIKPLQQIGRDADGTFLLIMNVIFKDSLFRATVKVRTNGLVNLSDEELLIEDMPVLDDTFGQ